MSHVSNSDESMRSSVSDDSVTRAGSGPGGGGTHGGGGGTQDEGPPPHTTDVNLRVVFHAIRTALRSAMARLLSWMSPRRRS